MKAADDLDKFNRNCESRSVDRNLEQKPNLTVYENEEIP